MDVGGDFLFPIVLHYRPTIYYTILNNITQHLRTFGVSSKIKRKIDRTNIFITILDYTVLDRTS